MYSTAVIRLRLQFVDHATIFCLLRSRCVLRLNQAAKFVRKLLRSSHFTGGGLVFGNKPFYIDFHLAAWAAPAGWRGELPFCALCSARHLPPVVIKNYMCPFDPSRAPLSQRKVYVKIHEMCQKTQNTIHSQCGISFYFRSLTAKAPAASFLG